MNQNGTVQSYEQQQQEQQNASGAPMAEIPSYPVSGEQPYIPQAPTQEAPPVYQAPVEQNRQKTTEAQPQYNTPAEQHNVPVSKMPEMQTPLEYQTTRSGERYFSNPELGQATFKGGVTSTQLVNKISGYYSVNQTLVANPQSGILQQTAQSGNPQSATTWQATVIFKILQAFWKLLGVV